MKRLFITLVLGMFLISLASAEYLPHKQNTELQFSFTSNNATSCNITIANTPEGVITINQESTKSDQTFNNTIGGGNFTILGNYCFNIECSDGVKTEGGSVCRYITPTGKSISDVGQISTGIIYFYLILGLGLVGLGFLFLRNNSIWISYTGLFIMLIGFTFVYYDLHLTNLYAQTIAVNSGAENVTSGVFLLVLRFIKLAPYIVAGIIAFASVKVLRATINKRKNNDGWDNNDY